MSKSSFLVAGAAAALLFAASASSQDLYVDAKVLKAGNGTSWLAAFKDLSAALKAAKSGQTIWVASGTYSGGFSIPAGVSIVGGFDGGDTRYTQRSVGEKPAILDGGGKQRVLTLGQGSSVDGFFVQNGRATTPGGGGVLILGATASVKNCGFLDNDINSGRGSAAYVGADSNSRGADARFENCVFSRNGQVTKIGHVVDIEASKGVFRNCIVDNNNDNGLHMQASSSFAIYNSVFSNNTGRGLCHIDAGSQPTFENNLMWNNTRGLYHYRGKDYTNINDVNALSYAKNNITGDPMFTDNSKLDYSLKAKSPLIDAGRELAGAELLDVDGNLRRLDGDRNGFAKTDIGAIEYSNVYIELLSGKPSPGQTIVIDSDGFANTPVIMAASLGVAKRPVMLAQLGYVFTDLLQPSVLLGWAPVGKSMSIKVPALPVGSSVVLQAAAGTATWGNLSNPLDIRRQ